MNKILIVEDESLVAHHLKLVLTAAGYKISGVAESVDEALANIADQRPDLVLLDIHLKGELNGIDLAKKLTNMNLAFVYLTANFQGKLLEEAKSTMPYGFIVKPFREDDLLTTLDVAFYRHQNSMESCRLQERELNLKLKEIRDHEGNEEEKLAKVADVMQTYVPFDFLNFVFRINGETDVRAIGFLRVGFEEYQLLQEKELLTITGIDRKKLKTIYGSLPVVNRPNCYNGEDFDRLCHDNPLSKLIADTYDFDSALLIPVVPSNSYLIRYEFYNRKGNAYSQLHINLLAGLVNVMGTVAEPTIAQAPVSSRSAPVVTRSGHTASPAEYSRNFNGIVGQSRPMLTVLDLIATVSPLNTSVLILGESGTGKERVAKSIHAMSARKNKPLIVVNCASLPANLIESELFGHEKGAFTGALEKRIGKFELAHEGTIFLDEIGEMSVDLQVKLLRVLQEQEIERLGGRGPVKINVRIIAATNRDLEKEMEEGRFRLDLYYRLFVFPIVIPPLKERKDDIPDLLDHFIRYYSNEYGKQITGVSPDALNEILNYSWPGNVRELEHFIERSILLSKGSEITEIVLPKQPGNQNAPETVTGRMKTIDENERDYILSVLKNCNGRIRGAGGAAEVMGLPPTTLHSKMKRLGIK